MGDNKLVFSALRNDILKAVSSSQDALVLRPLELSGRPQNEMLFFFKPECFLQTTEHQRAALIDLALERFEVFGVAVAGALVVNGKWLRERSVMDRHYGFINLASRGATSMLSEDALATIRTSTGESSGTPIFGGHEFLAANPSQDEKSLEEIWASKKSKKLRSGLYFEAYEIDGQRVILVNGFHPLQLAHFTADDRRIVLLVLHSDLPWRVLRSLMLGDTFPERAANGSFRRALHDGMERFGLSDVSIANNYSHLSAGPFEAMFELWNFLAKDSTAGFRLEQTKMWDSARVLGAAEAALHRSLQNPTAIIAGVERSLFEVTEETDTSSAAHLFLKEFESLGAD